MPISDQEEGKNNLGFSTIASFLSNICLRHHLDCVLNLEDKWTKVIRILMRLDCGQSHHHLLQQCKIAMLFAVVNSVKYFLT